MADKVRRVEPGEVVDEKHWYIARFLVEARPGGTTARVTRADGTVEQHYIREHHSMLLELRPGDEFFVVAGYAYVTALNGGIEWKGTKH